MSNTDNVKLPSIGSQIIQGAYGRRAKEKIKEQEKELLNIAKEVDKDPKLNRAKRLRWDNQNRRK